MDSAPDELIFILFSYVYQFDPPVILALPSFVVLTLHALGVFFAILFISGEIDTEYCK